MVSESEVISFAREIGERFHPEKVILFGSHATGGAGDDSDVDVLVIMDHEGRSARQALDIRRAVNRAFPLDLIVHTPAEVRRRLDAGDPFITESLAHGRVLYENATRDTNNLGSKF